MQKDLGTKFKALEVPTDADIMRHQQGQLASQIQDALEAELAPAHEILQGLMAEGQLAPEEVAAAAIHLLAEQNGVQITGSEDKRPSWAKPANDDFGEPEADEDFSQSWETAELFFPIGQRRGIQPGDLIKALDTQAGVSGAKIGRIQIYHRKSFACVPEDVAKALVESGAILHLKGEDIPIRLSDGGKDTRGTSTKSGSFKSKRGRPSKGRGGPGGRKEFRGRGPKRGKSTGHRKGSKPRRGPRGR